MTDLIKVNQPSGILRKSKTITTNTKIGYGTSTVESSEIGIFADVDIRDGKVIEISPYLEVAKNILQIEGINDYVFKIDDNRFCVGLGYISLYKHYDKPNAEWVINEEQNEIRIIATEDITRGEEITISYGESYWESRDSIKIKNK